MQPLSFANVEIQPDKRRVMVGGKPAMLGSRAFDLLMCLVEHRDRVVGKEELLRRIWPGVYVEESNLTVHVSALRKWLGPQAIATVSGRGYRFVAGAASEDPAPAPPLDKPSLAVMPFANQSGDAFEDYLVDGVVDSITMALSRVQDFFVIARSSGFSYKGRVVDVPRVGRELGVRYVVEGSVRQCGERMRIMVQLVETSAGRILWSKRFDGLRDQLFELEDRIVEQVVAAIEPKVKLAERDLSHS